MSWSTSEDFDAIQYTHSSFFSGLSGCLRELKKKGKVQLGNINESFCLSHSSNGVSQRWS